jgi:xanthine/CO dehydrogenase XdhC/CoxF family maturation factor
VSEIRDVLAAISALSARDEPMALATIVATRGSTYRRAGARLLIPAEGEPIGNLSGGCLEDDVARIGRGVMATGQPTLLSFDMTAEGDEVWGYGLGCNGAIDVFVEPAAMAVETAQLFLDAIDGYRAAALVTVVESSDAEAVAPGARVLLAASGERRGGLGADDELERAALEAASVGLSDGQSRLVELRTANGVTTRAFVEVAWPPLRVVVCGAGHDVIPLVRQATGIGWNVVVADIRRALLNHERFPDSAGFIDANPPEAAGVIGLDSRTAVVVMTHNYLRDAEYIRSFAEAGISRLAYLGMLGPRGRTQKLLAELEASGCALTDADRSRLHAPAGLDLGAEEPEEVAAAIVAEILSVERGHSGRPLRETSGPIHGAAGP